MRSGLQHAERRYTLLGLGMLLFSLATIAAMLLNLSAMERNRALVYRTLALDIGQTPMNYLLSRDDFQRRKELIVLAISGITLLLSVNGVLLYFVIRINRRLREAERTKSEMISAITHDAKFYLTVLKGRVDLLRMKLEEGNPGETLADDLQVVSENASSLNRLLINLNDHELLIKGKVDVIFQTIDLLAWLRSLLRSFEVLAQGREIRLEATPDGAVFQARTDPHLAEQILLNLLHNAHKFSPVGKPIEIRLAREDREFCLYIRDQGLGIPEAERERIFEPYVQLQPQIKGKGLGLANAREFARLLEGSLGVWETRLGQGTVFRLTLPAEREEARA